MANSVGPDEAAPLGADQSWPALLIEICLSKNITKIPFVLDI